MLQTNPYNQFTLYGQVIRQPVVYKNRDGSMKVSMTIAVEDEQPEVGPATPKTYQIIPVETFYGRRYVEIYGDSVKDAIRQGDVVSATGRFESHTWVSNDQTQNKLVLFCLDTPIRDPMRSNPVQPDTIPYKLYDNTGAAQPAQASQPAYHAPAPAYTVQPAAPTPAQTMGSVPMPGPATSLPFTLHDTPVAQAPVSTQPAAAPAQPIPQPAAQTPSHAQLPDPKQLPGAPTTLPLILYQDPAQPAAPAPAQAQTQAQAAPGRVPLPDPKQLPGASTTLPLILYQGPAQAGKTVQTPQAAPADPMPAITPQPQAPAETGSIPMAGPVTSLPFKFYCNGAPEPQPLQHVQVIPNPAPATAPAQAQMPDQTPALSQLPGSPDTLPFKLYPAPPENQGCDEPDAIQATAPDTVQDDACDTARDTASDVTPEATPDAPTKPAAPADITDLTDMSDLPFYFGSDVPPESIPGLDPNGGPARVLKNTVAGTTVVTVVQEPVKPAFEPNIIAGASQPVAQDAGIRTPAPNPGVNAPVSAWYVQSHYRTLKSGKRVLIKGHAAHRRPKQA